jgi:hypothetical protein
MIAMSLETTWSHTGFRERIRTTNKLNAMNNDITWRLQNIPALNQELTPIAQHVTNKLNNYQSLPLLDLL